MVKSAAASRAIPMALMKSRQVIARRASIALLMVGAPASAAEFSISGGPPASGGALGTCQTYSLFGTTPQAGSGSCTGDALGNSAGSSRADFGGVGAKATASQYVPSFSVPSIWGSGASFTDTVVFSSATPGVDFADVRVNLSLDGGIIGGGALDLDGRIELGFTAFQFRLSPRGSFPVQLGGLTVVSGTVVPLGLTDALLRTPSIRVPVNSPVGLILRLSARSGQIGNTGTVEFGSTFELPFGRDAFVLPEGVTANAGDWLRNNRRVGGPSAVPEPASWAMMIAGFGLAGTAARRRKPGLATC